jgi:hypothetical protein
LEIDEGAQHVGQEDPAFVELASSALPTLASQDPERAWAFVEAIPAGQVRDQTTSAFIEGITERYPDRAFEAIQRIESGDTRTDALSSSVGSYFDRDPAGSLRFLESADIRPEDARELSDSMLNALKHW